MNYVEHITAYQPQNEQEIKDKELILEQIRQWGDKILTRECLTAHITSSAFILNQAGDKTLMAYHKILDNWAWTGGHADGDGDLFSVARREATEETGITDLTPLKNEIASLDILPVGGHWKRGRYVPAHLHLSVAYLFCGAEGEELKISPEENTAVSWISTSRIKTGQLPAYDKYLYGKLLKRGTALLIG